MRTPRVSPGTRLKEVAAALIDATTSLKHGATVADIRSAHARLFATLSPRAFPDALARLEASGLAQRIGGRHRRTQWQHVSHPVPFHDPEDLSPVILETVAELCERSGRALESPEVHEALCARGHNLSVDQVRSRLESLAHASERKSQRSAGDWGQPRIRRISRTSAGGRQRVYWAPLESAPPIPSFSDASDAVRHAVGRAASEAGRPVTRREIKLWAKARLACSRSEQSDIEAARIVMSDRFRATVGNLAIVDQARGSSLGTIRVCRTTLSSRGQYAPRYSTEPSTEVQIGAGLLEDLASLLTPQTELSSIARLRSEAVGLGSALLNEIAATREKALATAVARYLPSEGVFAEYVRGGVALATSAHDAVKRWAEVANDYKALSALGAWEVPAFLEVLDRIEPALVDSADVVTIDQTEGVRLTDLELLALEALAVAERNVQYWSPLLARARRVRGPLAGGISCEDLSDTQSKLDRVDALRCLSSACYLPKLGTLVDSAVGIIGLVVRDPVVVSRWLERVPSGEPGVRQGLVVALGLMGAPPPADVAWPDPADPDQAAAYCVAVALGSDDQDERARLATEADFTARGPAVDVTDTTSVRIEGGFRLAVVS